MSPPNPVIVARICLVGAATVCVVGMVGPFQGVEKALIPWDKAAHFLAFYGATAVLYLAFPQRRRIDLTFMAALAGAAIELAQAMTGRDADVGDIFANALGACAVLAPTYIEPLRALSRAPQRRAPDRRRSRLFARPRPETEAADTAPPRIRT